MEQVVKLEIKSKKRFDKTNQLLEENKGKPIHLPEPLNIQNLPNVQPLNQIDLIESSYKAVYIEENDINQKIKDIQDRL